MNDKDKDKGKGPEASALSGPPRTGGPPPDGSAPPDGPEAAPKLGGPGDEFADIAGPADFNASRVRASETRPGGAFWVPGPDGYNLVNHKGDILKAATPPA